MNTFCDLNDEELMVASQFLFFVTFSLTILGIAVHFANTARAREALHLLISYGLTTVFSFITTSMIIVATILIACRI